MTPVGGFLTNAPVLRLTASVDRGSEHPLAAAIVKGAEDRGMKLSAIFQARLGGGGPHETEIEVKVAVVAECELTPGIPEPSDR